MPTHPSIPERYPVIEHMEARLAGVSRSPAVEERRAPSSVGGGALGFLAGSVGGAFVLAAFLLLV